MKLLKVISEFYTINLVKNCRRQINVVKFLPNGFCFTQNSHLKQKTMLLIKFLLVFMFNIC